MSAPDPPNVVWIAMEDTSPRLGCYGDDLARTPRIDDLAAEGRRYENAFVTAPVCAPSRSSIFTGCYPTSIGTHHMRTTHTNPDAPGLPTPYEAVPPHYVKGLTEYFRRAGYYCTLDSKADYQFGEPFTMWDHHGDGAGWWDDARGDGQPFFATFTNGVTHESGMWDPEEGEQFGGAVEEPETDPDAVEVPPYLPDAEPTRLAIARQYDNVARSDAWVGDLLDRLDADGHAEDTLVVLWSDHGEGLPRAKRWVYDAGTRVPLVVRWPGAVDGGEATDRLVSLVDLAPTMLSACRLDVPRWMEGRPFLDAGPDEGRNVRSDEGSDEQPDVGRDERSNERRAATEREYVFASRDRYDESYDVVRAVRDDRYRYVRHYEPGRPYRLWIPFRNRHPVARELLAMDAAGELEGTLSWFGDARPAEELYDLHADPHETENLADDPAHAGALDRLRDALDDWMDHTGDLRRVDEATMVHDRWRGDDQPATATPTFVPNAPGNREREATPDGAELEAPATLSIHCATQGASIGYAIGDGTDTGRHWRPYDGPIDLPAGETTVRTKAVRYGFAESDVRVATFEVS